MIWEDIENNSSLGKVHEENGCCGCNGIFRGLSLNSRHLLCRCYNYWFWVPLVAPLVGGVMGSFLYLLFIEWQLPEAPQPQSLPPPSPASSICHKVKHHCPQFGNAVDTKAEQF